MAETVVELDFHPREGDDVDGEYVSLRRPDVIGIELQRIGLIRPGEDFVEKPVLLKAARFYRPSALFGLLLVVTILVVSIFIYDQSTGLRQVMCETLPKRDLLVISWVTIGIALIIAFIGIYIIYGMPSLSCLMDPILRTAPIDHCILSDEERRTILTECVSNERLNVSLAGSAGDGFGCFFGQNGNIGLNKLIDYCQDLDINIVYSPESTSEFILRQDDPGLVNVVLTSACSLSKFKDIERLNCLSGTKILDEMGEILPPNIGATNSLKTPPALRIQKTVTVNNKPLPVQYDYVFSLVARSWPIETQPLLDQYGFLSKERIYVVPKPWKNDETNKKDTIWRYSFTEAERSLFQHFVKHHKMLVKCYIVLKFVIKFQAVSRFPWRSACRKLPFFSWVSLKEKDKTGDEKALKSFYLKTIFLYVADEMEKRRLAPQIYLDNVDQEGPSEYRFNGSASEIYSTLSTKISEDPEGIGPSRSEDSSSSSTVIVENGDDIFNENTDGIRGRARRCFSRLRHSCSFFCSGVACSAPKKDVRTLSNDDLFCLILRLYISALTQRKLRHFFMRNMNLLVEIPKSQCTEGIETLNDIYHWRVRNVLDYLDLWGNRFLMQLAYIVSSLMLLLLIALLIVMIYGTVYLFTYDPNDINLECGI